MKKTKLLITAVISLALTLSFIPAAVPQVGTYTFHGAPGNVKILKVRTANNASLQDLFGPSYAAILESFFNPGCLIVGAESKSLVTGVNFSAKFDPLTYVFPVPGLGIFDVTEYNTSNWYWTTSEFSSTPDSTGDVVISFYDPTNLTKFINTLYNTYFFTPYNISTHTAGSFLAQLPTSVAQYLGALVWEPGWQNVANTIVHTALEGSFIFGTAIQYLEDCTEIWTYDSTYGAWIGYQILDNESNIIYKFSIELAIPGIPGFELSIFLGITGITSIGMIYVVMKKKK